MLQRTPVVAGVVGLATLVAGIAAVLTDAPTWLVALLGLVPLLGTAAAARYVLHNSARLWPVESWRKTCTAWLVTLATVLHVAWIVTWSWSPGWGLWLVPGLPVLTWAECGGALLTRRALLRPRTQAEQEQRQQRQQGRVTAELSRAVQRFRRALDEGDWGYVQILGPEDRRGPHTTVFHVQVPARATARLLQEEAHDGKRTLLPFNEGSAPALAASLSQVLRHPLREKWVEVKPTGFAGYFDVIVMTRDVMGDMHPFVDQDLSPITLDTPCGLGVQPDGSPALLPLRGHGVISAASGSGKTNLMYLIISHLLRAGVVVWGAGRRKQYETWAMYLLRYLDSRHQAVIDWLVNGQRDTVQLLLATWLLAQDRQATPFDERETWAPLYVFLDEATDVLVDTGIVIEYQGEHYNASQLLAMISRGVKSADIYLVVILHKGTNGQFGSQGSVIKVAFDWSIVLRSNDRDDAARVLGTRAPELEHPGEIAFRRGGGPVVRAKAHYVQEVGKPSAPKTNGTPVPEVGWNRRDMANTLDRRGSAAAGQHYAKRPRLVTPEYMAYLQDGDENGVEQVNTRTRTSGTSAAGAVRGGAQAVEDQAFDAYLAKLEAGAGITPSTPAGQDVAPIAPAAKKKTTRRALVLDVLAECGPLDSTSLIAELRNRGDEVTRPNGVYNLLRQMREDERVIKQQPDKRYVLVKNAAA